MLVRVSVGNLAMTVMDEDGRIYFVGILNSGAFKKGRRLFQPIGGAAKITQECRDLLGERFGAKEFHKFDARFVVDDANLEEIFQFFESRESVDFETDPSRELIEELSKEELLGISAVLTLEEAESIESFYERMARQPFSDDAGTSPLAIEGIPNRRLFRYFVLSVSKMIIEKMKQSPAIHFLSTAEINTTKGGTQRGMTLDGEHLADNFIW